MKVIDGPGHLEGKLEVFFFFLSSPLDLWTLLMNKFLMSIMENSVVKPAKNYAACL